MKFERLSENQIRCTLNKKDLSEKQLKLSELAYGSPKARELFSEVMQKASYELGFEVENSPLMIEAIPVSGESIVLIVTKVDEPEELDTRFSRFTEAMAGVYDDAEADDEEDDEDYDLFESPEVESAAPQGLMGSIDISLSGNKQNLPEEVYNALEGFISSLATLAEKNSDTESKSDATEEATSKTILTRAIVFDSLNTAITAAKHIGHFYCSSSTLYKDESNNCFYLLFTDSANSSAEFNRATQILGEFGSLKKLSPAMPYYFKEHYKLILEDDAITKLSIL